MFVSFSLKVMEFNSQSNSDWFQVKLEPEQFTLKYEDDQLEEEYKPVLSASASNSNSNLTKSTNVTVEQQYHQTENIYDESITVKDETQALGAEKGFLHLKTELKCNFCHKVFTTDQNLRKHTSTHTGKKPFVCDICHSAFRLKDYLKNHLQTHAEYKYKCHYCNKILASKRTLILHINVHTQDSPFKCDYCDKKFTSSASLKYHTSYIHHGIDSEAPEFFTCKECGLLLTSRGSLNYHERTHTGQNFKHPCKQCSQVYTTAKRLVEHVRRVHTKVTPYGCDTCDRAFVSVRLLKSHSQTHKRGIDCIYCTKKLRTSHLLQIHIRKFHVIEKRR